MTAIFWRFLNGTFDSFDNGERLYNDNDDNAENNEKDKDWRRYIV